MTVALKCVKQEFIPDTDISGMMESYRRTTNQCIRMGLQKGLTSLKSLSNATYQSLDKHFMSYYRLCAISKAAGILSARKKSIKRGFPTKSPYLEVPMLVSCYHFKVEDGMLKIPMGEKRYFNIPLNSHTQKIISNPEVKRIHSFTLSSSNNTLSIAYSKEAKEIECNDVVGVDRNLCNVTVGNVDEVVDYNISKADNIATNTKSIYKSFKRNDVRIRTKLYGKYGKRRSNRVNQILHKVSKTIANNARSNKTAIAFEDLINIRKLYRKGNGQGNKYRGNIHVHTMKIDSYFVDYLTVVLTHSVCYDRQLYYKRNPFFPSQQID